ncbi:hypothetical protein [Arthrobacter rhombi]|uniref:hypothetical protein n=1 Tax=Arthrobacter rhombi TaxID=71253 RepID=UPI003FD3A2E7
MSHELPDRPEKGRRRPKAAPDENVDPIESPRTTPAPLQKATPQVEPKIIREPFNARLDPKVIQVLHQVKASQGIKIYEAVEQAIEAHWGGGRQ